MSGAAGQADGSNRYLGLSFSGGGYRAAAFSLGALALLKDLGLLGRATVLSGVSGGSIALGAYLCAKAGAELENRAEADDDRCFYDTFYGTFLAYLSTQKMAKGFAHLSWLLKNRKLIKGAADANHVLFSKLLGQEALLGSDRIHTLLNNGQRSPDYAFFNAADISTLNLFRFGLQKHRGKDGSNDLAIVIGRWILTPRAWRNSIRDLYQFSKQLRVADCVAASHAFPLGLEPMVFPGDFVPSGPERRKALDAFAGSELCEGKQALGLLDGGLYDNLGLASVEDIRVNLYPQSSKVDKSAVNCCAPFVVIATDVDNIQPGISFYDASQTWTTPKQRRSGALRRWIWIGLGIIVGGVVFIIPPWTGSPGLAAGSLLACLLALVLPILRTTKQAGKWKLAGPRWTYGAGLVLGLAIGSLLYFAQAKLLVPAALAGLLALASVVAIPAALRWLRGLLKPGLTKVFNKLGFSEGFVERRSAGDSRRLGKWLQWRTLFGQAGCNLMEALRFNLLVQRGGQPVPMFSGYLKRTRSLTYGYLEGKYRDERQHSCAPWPHLVRNMIFELTQGADADPDFAAELITLPVQTLTALNVEQEEVYRETSVMRKIRHAHFAAGLIQQQAQQRGVQPVVPNPDLPGRNPCVMEIWAAGHKTKQTQATPNQSERGNDKECSHDQQLQQLIERLQLTQAAELWDELLPALRVGPNSSTSTQTTHPSGEIERLLTHVVMLLQRALRQGDIHEPTVLENCRISPEPVATEYSWIPMICEMATNLPTTLWIKGYRYYVPNLIAEGRIVKPGAWYSRKPTSNELQDRPLLDLGESESISNSTKKMKVCPAAAITTLAGYITTVFNLLEYYYSYLEYSESLVNGLARTLASRSQPGQSGSFEPLKNCGCQKAVMELPFLLRQRVDRKLHQHWQWLQAHPDGQSASDTDKPREFDPILMKRLKKLQAVSDPQVRLDLLKPWLRSRGPFPQSWWDGCDESKPASPTT